MCFCTIRLASTIVLMTAAASVADTLITDFNSAPLGSSNPHAGWTAFGNGTQDSGVIAAGSVGRCAYHSVDWDQATTNIGEREVLRDLTGFGSVRVDARIIDTGGYTGTALMRFELSTTDGTVWGGPTVPINGVWTTYTFDFAPLARLSGSAPLDLAAAKPRFIVPKNGQSGDARFDFDEVYAIDAATDSFALSAVTLQTPADGDAVRAMWFYAHSIVDSQEDTQAVLDFCARQGVNVIYCDVNQIATTATFQQQQRLLTFIRTARASGIRIEALMGDTGWPNDPDRVREKLDEILALHNMTPSDADDDFDGVHFDVEFWNDPTWDAAPDEADRQQIARDYLDNVLLNARDHLDAQGSTAVQIGVDLSANMESPTMLPNPFSYNASTQPFVGHVLDRADTVVLMSYIDSASGLYNWTGFELDLAFAKGRTLQLGADLEPVPPAVPVNSFADNPPDPYTAMTTALTGFHAMLSPNQLAALDGFSVFQFESFVEHAPGPPIPTLGQWGAVVMLIALLAAGTLIYGSAGGDARKDLNFSK